MNAKDWCDKHGYVVFNTNYKIMEAYSRYRHRLDRRRVKLYKEQNEELKKLLTSILDVKDLWMPVTTENVPPEHIGEVEMLMGMGSAIEETLNKLNQ